ncbi:MAG: DoxX family protein [Gammaproteobacteria bacterium]
MKVSLPLSRLLFAAAMIALGITGLVNGDFALAWQYVPPHLPGHTAIAYLCAIIELALGVGLLFKPTLTLTCRILFPYMLLWLLVQEIPAVVQAPLDPASWGRGSEIAIITVGAWCLFATQAGAWESQHLRFAVGSHGIRAARWVLVVALPFIGREVIVDAVKYGDKVMQPWLQWLPHPMAWACLTGIGSFAACLGLLFGVWPRLAAATEAAMLGLITVAYWAPDLYTGRTATTALIISFLITAGVWLVADTYRGVPWFATRRPVWKV